MMQGCQHCKCNDKLQRGAMYWMLHSSFSEAGIITRTTTTFKEACCVVKLPACVRQSSIYTQRHHITPALSGKASSLASMQAFSLSTKQGRGCKLISHGMLHEQVFHRIRCLISAGFRRGFVNVRRPVSGMMLHAQTKAHLIPSRHDALSDDLALCALDQHGSQQACACKVARPDSTCQAVSRPFARHDTTLRDDQGWQLSAA